MSRSHKAVRKDDDLRPEYDFRGGVRGKYFERYQRGTNVVLLDPDVAVVFKDAVSVNDALRTLVAVAKAEVSAAARRSERLRSHKGAKHGGRKSTSRLKTQRRRAARG